MIFACFLPPGSYGLRQSFVVASAILAHNIHELQSGRNTGERCLFIRLFVVLCITVFQRHRATLNLCEFHWTEFNWIDLEFYMNRMEPNSKSSRTQRNLFDRLLWLIQLLLQMYHGCRVSQSFLDSFSGNSFYTDVYNFTSNVCPPSPTFVTASIKFMELPVISKTSQKTTRFRRCCFCRLSALP